MPNPLFLFVVVQHDDGSISVDTSVPEGVQVARQASQLDILDATRKITADLDHQRLVESLAQIVTAQAPTASVELTPAQRVQAQLAQRAAEKAAAEAAAEQTADAVTEDAEKDDPEV
jgi:6-pyruvoyl-tetrahydropterin synthase